MNDDESYFVVNGNNGDCDAVCVFDLGSENSFPDTQRSSNVSRATTRNNNSCSPFNPLQKPSPSRARSCSELDQLGSRTFPSFSPALLPRPMDEPHELHDLHVGGDWTGGTTVEKYDDDLDESTSKVLALDDDIFQMESLRTDKPTASRAAVEK